MLSKLQFKAGVDRENTNYSNEGGWFECDKIRFRSGYPEKIGGWLRLSSAAFLGVCRSIINWVTLTGDNLLGLGTSLKYYIERGGAYYDVTPVRRTASLTNPFKTLYSTLDGAISSSATSILLASTTNFPTSGVVKIGSEQIWFNNSGSTPPSNTLINCVRGYNGTTAASHSNGDGVGCSSLLVTDTSNGVVLNDFVTFSGASDVGGITAATYINKELQVAQVKTANTYYVVVGEFPTSAVSAGGGTVTADYQVNTGLDTATAGVGWGSGAWGRSTWGSDSGGGAQTQLRLWNQATYGEDLIINPRGGALYYWDASTGTSVRASAVADMVGASDVPLFANYMMVSDVSRFVLVFGTNPEGSSTLDPMYVRWSDSESITDWTSAVTNQAGGIRLSHGSEIIAVVNARQENVVWTDTSLYSMQYLGPPFVWGFNLIADDVSIMSPQAFASVNNVVYWMGVDKFYMYSGRVQTLPCTLRQHIFEDINLVQSQQVICGTNAGYNEIWWFYCSADSNTIDRYVVFNHLENVWYYGSMSRTAWLDSPLRDYPMAIESNKVLYHEYGADDQSATTAAPISAYIQSADVDIEDGEKFSYVWRMVPDVSFSGSTASAPKVLITLKPRKFPGSNYSGDEASEITRTSTVPVEQYTTQVYPRLRGRQLSFRIESSELGVRWQLGSPRIDIKPDGRR